MNVASRPAVAGDLDWLVALRVRTMGPNLAAAGEPASPGGAARPRPRALRRHPHRRPRRRSRGHAQGRALPGRRRLVQLQLEPMHQRRGLGTRLVRELLADAHREGVPVTLSVLKVNPARCLYERLGFSIVAERERSFDMRAGD